MSALKKNQYVNFLPGSPYVPSTPGTPAQSAYSYNVATRTSTNATGGTTFGAGGSTVSYGAPYTQSLNSSGNLVYVPTVSAGQSTNLFSSGGYSGSSTIYVPAVAAVPPTPSVSATQASLTTQLGLGWNSGAYSIGSLSASGAFEFTAPASVMGVVAGLNDTSKSASYEEIDYGFYLTKSKYQIVEGGAQLGVFRAFSTGDVFRIERNGGVVSYFVNRVLAYTSGVVSTGSLLADSSLYSGGDAITTAGLLSGSSYVSAIPVSVAVSLAAITSFGSDRSMGSSSTLLQPLGVEAGGNEATSVANVNLRPMQSTASNKAVASTSVNLSWMTSSGTGAQVIDARTYLAPMTSKASDKPYAASSTRFQPMSTEANSGKFTPTYSAAIASLAYLTSASRGLTGELGQASVMLSGMRSLASDHAYGSSASEMLPMLSNAIEFPRYNAVADLTFSDPYVVSASGVRLTLNSFAGSAKYSFYAQGGAQAEMTLPKPLVGASGTTLVVGRVDATMPMGSLVASGMVGAVGGLSKTLPKITGVGYTGAVASITLQDGFTIAMSGTVGGRGQLEVNLPLYELSASGVIGGVGHAVLVAPMLRVIAANKANLVAPQLTLVAVGTAIVQVDYEAYSITLNKTIDAQERTDGFDQHPITHYTKYPFNQIVRFHDEYYGVSDAGVFLLGGDLDVSEPIAWEFETVLSDMGTTNLKRVVSVTVGGRILADIDITLVVGESGENRYLYKPVRGVNLQNYRQLFGKGVRTRYFAVNISSASGGTMDVDSLDFEIENLTRTL
jgi:hypothetical protein